MTALRLKRPQSRVGVVIYERVSSRLYAILQLQMAVVRLKRPQSRFGAVLRTSQRIVKSVIIQFLGTC